MKAGPSMGPAFNCRTPRLACGTFLAAAPDNAAASHSGSTRRDRPAYLPTHRPASHRNVTLYPMRPPTTTARVRADGERRDHSHGGPRNCHTTRSCLRTDLPGRARPPYCGPLDQLAPSAIKRLLTHRPVWLRPILTDRADGTRAKLDPPGPPPHRPPADTATCPRRLGTPDHPAASPRRPPAASEATGTTRNNRNTRNKLTPRRGDPFTIYLGHSGDLTQGSSDALRRP